MASLICTLATRGFGAEYKLKAGDFVELINVSDKYLHKVGVILESPADKTAKVAVRLNDGRKVKLPAYYMRLLFQVSDEVKFDDGSSGRIVDFCSEGNPLIASDSDETELVRRRNARLV